ncbi:MAG: type II secretion system minor pseudopilin GspK [Burkholderiaceae bacterium]
MKLARPFPRRRQQGVAVITALLLTTLAITIVASLFWQQQVQVRSIENQRLQLQKQWVLRGALDWARLILREDARYSRVDHLGEPWAVELADTRLDQYVESGQAEGDVADAVLSGHIVDAQSRFNLTNLASNGVVDPEQLMAFQRLLGNLQLEAGLAEATAETLVAGQVRSGQSAGGAGTGTGAGAGGSAGATPAQTIGITQVDDLLAVPGFTLEAYLKLKDFVTVLPATTKVNINTAPAEVLAAIIDTLSPSDAEAVISSRDRAYFRDEADVKQRFPAIDPARVALATQYFLVNGRVRINRAALQMQALIQRNGTTTKILWSREN